MQWKKGKMGCFAWVSLFSDSHSGTNVEAVDSSRIPYSRYW